MDGNDWVKLPAPTNADYADCWFQRSWAIAVLKYGQHQSKVVLVRNGERSVLYSELSPKEMVDYLSREPNQREAAMEIFAEHAAVRRQLEQADFRIGELNQVIADQNHALDARTRELELAAARERAYEILVEALNDKQLPYIPRDETAPIATAQPRELVNPLIVNGAVVIVILIMLLLGAVFGGNCG